jgi:hypothetical protein
LTDLPESVDELLFEARLGLSRLSPEEAAEALQRGAVLIDARPSVPAISASSRFPSR